MLHYWLQNQVGEISMHAPPDMVSYSTNILFRQHCSTSVRRSPASEALAEIEKEKKAKGFY